MTLPTHLKREFPVGPSGSICGGLQVHYKRQESDMLTHLKREFPVGPSGDELMLNVLRCHETY